MEGEVGGCDWGCAAVERIRFCLMRDLEGKYRMATSTLKRLGDILLGMYV